MSVLKWAGIFCFIQEGAERGGKDMKKMAVLLSTALCASLCGCGGGSDGSSYKVAIVKQMTHSSLDEITDAICAELDRISAEEGISIEYGEVYDGQNDQAQLTTISSQIAATRPDVIIPVATLAAQTMAIAAEENNIPLVFAAISDPSAAGLDGLDYVTGTSDALDTKKLMDMMFASDPDIETVGLLYSRSEVNSEKPIAEAKAYLEEKGVAYVEATGNTADELLAATGTLVNRVDAVFTPTDNIVMASENAIAEMLLEEGIPHYCGADSFVYSGAFVTCGINYTDLGIKTADLAFEVMKDGMESLDTFEMEGARKEDNYYVLDGNLITVNTDTAEQGGFTADVFADFGEVKEVTTGEGQ